MNVSLFLSALSTPISQIDDLIFLGNRQGALDLAELRRRGVQSVVQIQTTDTPPFLPEHFKYHRITIPDMPGQNLLRFLPAAVKFIHQEVRAGRKVFIHCDAGVSRSVSVTVAYYMATRHWTFTQALDFVRSGRQCAFPNEGFQQQLQSLDLNKIAAWTS